VISFYLVQIDNISNQPVLSSYFHPGGDFCLLGMEAGLLAVAPGCNFSVVFFSYFLNYLTVNKNIIILIFINKKGIGLLTGKFLIKSGFILSSFNRIISFLCSNHPFLSASANV